MHGLFEEGRAIIPALVNVLDSNVSASVLCGTNSLFFELVTVDFNAPFEPEDGHGGTVGEIALYLIESIIKDDIYFARTCSLEIDDEVISDSALVQKKIQAVASVLETLSSEELENLSAKDFDELMREHKLGFPQKKSEP